MVRVNGQPAARASTVAAMAGYQGYEDSELVALVRDGVEDAFAELYKRHVGAVRLAVGDRVRDAETRADLVQEAFIRALAAIDRLQDPAKFRPWVLQISRNLGIDHLRRQRVGIDSIDEETAPELVADDAGPAELSELADMASQLKVGLARLSERDATVLSMSVQFGFGPTEIADALGITPNHAKVVLHRARKRLRLAVELRVEQQAMAEAGG